jgi:hypothetical protein
MTGIRILSKAYILFDRIPKMILKYQPKGKRNLGRPLKRLKDSVL